MSVGLFERMGVGGRLAVFAVEADLVVQHFAVELRFSEPPFALVLLYSLSEEHGRDYYYIYLVYCRQKASKRFSKTWWG